MENKPSKKPSSRAKLIVEIAVIVVGFSMLALVVLAGVGGTRKSSDFNSCISSFSETSYKGRTDETKSEIQAINTSNYDKNRALCSDLFSDQPAILYLFQSSLRKQSVIRYCDGFAKGQELSAAQWKANPISVVLPFNSSSSYDQTFNQCVHRFGLRSSK